MGRELLSQTEIGGRLRELQDWSLRGNEIVKVVKKEDFVRAMAFVNAVALLAEKQNHHPDIDIRWNTVTLVLSTHSAGGLTENDFELAKAIDGV